MPTGLAPVMVREERVNFILFNPDEMRAESLGCYGHPTAQTPHLDRLAAEGVRFDQCHAQHPVCTPSRCSFMTGWYPHVRGHRTLWHALRPDEPNLLRYAKKAGYTVAMGGKNDLLAPGSFPLSVDEPKLERRSRRYQPLDWTARNPFPFDDPRYYSFLYEAHPDLRLENLHDFACVDGAIEFLRAGPTKPFLLYLPLGFPHCPFFAPKPFAGSHDPEALPAPRPAGLEGKPDFHEHIRRTRRLDQLGEDVLRQVNATYLDMNSTVDALLGQLLDALDETGYADNTTILFFSDHGEWAGDFGLVEKWPSALDDTITRVPLVIRAPGNRAGHVVREPVELFDIMPTVLEMAGIQPSHTHFAHSLVPQLAGSAGDAQRAVFAEGGYDPQEPHCFEGRHLDPDPRRAAEEIYYPKVKLQQDHPESVCRAAMVRTATHKLIHRPHGQSELYDLEADPNELENRIEDPALASERSRLERRLLDWYVATSDVTPFEEDPRGFPE